MGGLRVSTRLITFARIAILARILSPLQFGLFGIASLVLAFLEIITETGVNIFFIQKEGKLSEFIDTAWVVSIARGLFISLLLVFSAPFVTGFFNTPQATELMYLISLVPFVRGFINPAVVKYQKDLEFSREFIMRFAIFLTDSMFAIIIGLVTRRADSLVYGMLIGSIVEVLYTFFFISPRPRVRFNFKQFKNIIDRGKWVTGYGLFNYAFENGDDIIVGKLLSTQTLGIYQMAYKISTLPITEIADVFIKVTFPVYAKISKEKLRLKRAFIKTTLIVSSIVVPFGLVIFVFAHPIVKIILGEQWLNAVPVLRILAFFGIIRAISHPSIALLLALQKQEIVMFNTLINLGIMLVLIVPFIAHYGLVGSGYAVLLSSLVSMPIVFFSVHKALALRNIKDV